MRVVVIGAGVAGSSAGLAFAQDGHDVVVVDRTGAPPLTASSADEVFDTWDRPAVGQFRQPHNFLGLGRTVLRDRFPSVYAAVVGAGAGEVDMASFLGDTPRLPGDEDLATIACRRPVFDAALREALVDRVEVRIADVTGLTVRAGAVAGVVLDGGETVAADLVLDAAGRRTHASDWLVAAGRSPFPAQSNDCGLLYYSRHYRVRDGEAMPAYASLLGGPRGDIGYLAFATFLGDNRTFSLAVMVPVWDKDFRALRDADAFDRVAWLLPGMAAWLTGAVPASSVLPMGQLRNTVRRIVDHDRSVAPGLVPLGDALSHTNPTFAFGASLSLAQGARLADLAAAATDPSDLAVSFDAAIGADVRQRFRAVSAEDADRLRLWSGEPLDVTDRTQSMALFLRFVVYRASAGDPDLLRAVARRINALDPPDRLAEDDELLDRGAALYASLPPAAVPARATLLTALSGGS